MKRTIIVTAAALLVSGHAFAGQLTEAQRAKQREQQVKAQQAYSSSAQSYKEAKQAGGEMLSNVAKVIVPATMAVMPGPAAVKAAVGGAIAATTTKK